MSFQQPIRLYLSIIFALSTFTFSENTVAQSNKNGIVQGRVVNAKNNDPIPFATLVVQGTTIGSISDLDGNFIFTGLTPGFIEIQASSIGFKTTLSTRVLVTNANRAQITIAMEEEAVSLEQVEVRASPFRRNIESPNSLRRIDIVEIEKNPGGNRDISKVIQSLPGVASTPAFRNDVIVRGGGSSENRFYIDEVEIPNLNHFATQGASGGPVGIINVDFVREVNFYSGSFPANKGNALSSVFDFKFIDGNTDQFKTRLTVGASDLGLTLNGPLNQKTTFIASGRLSYLQFLFTALQLPFLPTYSDYQFKTKTRFDKKNELTLLGLGAVDQFKLNTGANETREQRYQLSYLPVNEQWNYTVGAVYKHFRGKSYDTWVLSRNHLNNTSYKYKGNNTDSLKLLDYVSNEIENKLRYEYTLTTDNNFKINAGAGTEYALYDNSTIRKRFINGASVTQNYVSTLDLIKYSLFGSVSKDLIDGLVSVSLGTRFDGNNYSSEMNNPIKQFSPRISASYAFIENWRWSVSLGRYYQLPPYTALGFRDNNEKLVNKINGIKYIKVDHLVSGFDWTPNTDSKLTFEGFYKWYADYPFSVTDSISIASKGADYGTFGDEELVSTGKGRAYGLEILYRNRNLYGSVLTLSYTWVRSEFKNNQDKYVPSAWDNRHIFNVLWQKSFKRNWDIGFKWRLVGGAPYTPADLDVSSLQSAWDVQNQTYLDYSRYNNLRLKSFNQLDVRVDKQYFFSKWSLMIYLDIQNVLNWKADVPPTYVRAQDADGNLKPASGNPPRYELEELQTGGSGTILPTIGIMIEF